MFPILLFSMRGTCDISVSKMLCLHIPSLIPQHFSTIDVASTVQAAAVAGAGLLYEGSSHRMMTEFLLNEIGKRPSNDGNVLDREAYTLACGIALGMVNLCKGSEGSIDTGAGLADLRIEERLYRYIVGGLDDADMRRRYEETDRLSLPPIPSSNTTDKCSCIYEGDSINIDVTAPGATLALGLMYMKSGNKTIASAIALPDTHFLLEYVRPDFLMFRVISRALILWNEVEPTEKWIQAQIPKAAHTAYKEMRDLAESIQLDGIGAAAKYDDKDYDRQAVRYIYTHVISAACFSIGLRFAGTGNTDAASVIFERVMELRELRDAANPISAALRPPTPVLEMCLGCAAISLSMVLAGTGNLDALRLFKILRWPCTDDISYGSHQAYGTAIGLLFLGGGSCTLGRDPKDIAALIMAFYPRFPSSTSDNQYHLQALRNLYALAVKKRELKAIDVDTGECVFAPIEVHFANESLDSLHLTAPCLLVNTDEKPCELRVVSKQHYPLTITLDDDFGNKSFYVKRRSAHMYGERPKFHTSLTQTDSSQGRESLELIASFTDDQRVLAFAKYFCDFCQPQTRKNNSGQSMAQFCSRILHECFLLDSQQALPLYLALRSAINMVNAGCSARVAYAWDFRLIRSYYQEGGLGASGRNSHGLLNCELITYLIELLEYALSNGNFGNNLLSVFHESPHKDRIQKLETDEMDLS
jgi:anaphase-promoting complex subunit 1